MRVALLLVLVVLVLAIIGPAHMAFHGDDLDESCSACHLAGAEFDHEFGLLVDSGSAQSCDEPFLCERILAPCLGQLAPRAPPLG
jgi:hypothetical protein